MSLTSFLKTKDVREAFKRDKEGEKMQKHKQVVVVVKPKSRFIAVLLAMFFGPLGLFYSTIRGGIITSIMLIVLSVLASKDPMLVLKDPSKLALLMELMLLPVNIFVCAPWAFIATTRYNKKLLSDLK